MKGDRLGIVFTVVSAVLPLGAIGSGTALEVGDKAPPFTLPATTQEKLSLADLIGKKNVVLFGFIGAFTPT
jgi:cytochrome oxidase Cu insertion factor (SCO1/SenC/PrrC family)